MRFDALEFQVQFHLLCHLLLFHCSDSKTEDLRIQPFGSRTQTFRVFLEGRPATLTPELAASIREVDRKGSWKAARDGWSGLLNGRERLWLRLPDKRAQEAFYASLGHLLCVMNSPEEPRPDPRRLAAALLRAGHPEAAAPLSVEPAEAWSLPVPPGPSAPAADPAAAWLRDGTYRPAEALELARRAANEGDAEAAAGNRGGCLKHQTAPGAYAWAASADPVAFAWAGGRLPDPGAAASLVCLLRDMLVREEGDSLLITAGIPAAWATPGGQLEIKMAPTRFGTLPGYSLVASPGGLTLRLYRPEQLARQGRGPVLDPAQVARPPGGLRWRVPGTRRIRALAVDGGRVRTLPADRWVALPEGARKVSVSW